MVAIPEHEIARPGASRGRSSTFSLGVDESNGDDESCIALIEIRPDGTMLVKKSITFPKDTEPPWHLLKEER